ncbi:MAG TPA: imidazole glycerol phosphate synthase subunit HisH [Capillimicrobium sp.]
MIAVVDYGMGNLRSMAKAIEHVGGDVTVTSDARALRAAERYVLPGVGAFGEAMANLRSTGIVDVLAEQVLEAGKPLLGVCLGMQLLARGSREHGRHAGLGWLEADVLPLAATEPALRIPHTGWTAIELDAGPSSPFARIRPGEAFYFNHSLHVVPDDPALVSARAEHGQPVVAAIEHRSIAATQFHPEKSQQAGLELLADFLDWEPQRAQAMRTSTP